MKTITEGDKRFARWWTGIAATCRDCGHAVELEARDDCHPLCLATGPRMFEFACPNCNGRVRVVKPSHGELTKAEEVAASPAEESPES